MYLLKGEQQRECIFCECPLTLHYIFLECSDTLLARNLLLNNVQSMQNLYTKVNKSDCLQKCDIFNKTLHFYSFTFLTFILYFMSVECK